MDPINVHFSQLIRLPVGVVERTTDLAAGADGAWTSLTVGQTLPETHGGQIPEQHTTKDVVPTTPSLAAPLAAVRDALAAANYVEHLVVDVPRSGASTFAWREHGSTQTHSSTNPPAAVADLATALQALGAAARS